MAANGQDSCPPAGRYLAVCGQSLATAVSPDELPGDRPRRLTTDNNAKASFAQFVASPGYEAADLGTDIERFSFLLGGDDSEHLLT